MAESGTNWYWVGLSDAARPRGQRAIGAIVVEAMDAERAAERAARIAEANGDISDECELLAAQIEPKYGPPPAGWENRMLGPDEANRLAGLWTGGVASQGEIRSAFLDDDAKEGDPLFPRRDG